MPNKILRRILLLVLLCFPLSVSAQRLPELVTKIEKVFEEKEPKWKIERPYVQLSPPVIHLKSAQTKTVLKDVLVYVWIMTSSKDVKDVFDGNAAGFRSTNGKRKKESKLPNFGDDNHLWSDNSGGFSTFDFRQGNIYISVVAPSPAIAEKFARYVLEQVNLQNYKTTKVSA